MTAVAVARPLVAPWRRALPALVLLLVGIVALYRTTAIGMVEIWIRSETFTHAFLVLPIVLWLVWRQREALARQVPAPSPWWLLAMAAMGLAWLLGDLVAANAVTQLAFVAMLVLAVPTVLGTQIARALVFPLGFMFFGVPLGEFLLPLFIAWTADFTVFALKLSGIPVYREGTQFIIPTGSWSVVEACSGIRYLIASLMVGVLFAYVNYSSTRRRLVFVGISILVPVLANWLRAYMIVMLGHLSGNQLAVGADHLVYGWAFFGIVITLMFMIGARWSEPLPAAGSALPAVPSGTAPHRIGGFLGIAVAAAVLLALPHEFLRAVVGFETPGRPTLTEPADLAGAWQPVKPLTEWTPLFEKPSVELHRAYASGGRRVGLYVAYYRHQTTERKLVSSQNVLVKSNDKVWARVEEGSRAVDAPGHGVVVRTALLRGLSTPERALPQRLHVWQFYWVGGVLTSSDHRAKLAGAWQRLRGGGDDGAAVILYAPEDGSANIDADLETFLRDNLGRIEQQLAKARGGG